jgi:N-carbamoyl-L-amino-acid hydrolase
MHLEINSKQLQRELEKLATYSDVPSPAVTRVVYSATDLAARRYVKQLCRDAGLAIREDAAGNTFARWSGSDASLAAVGTGSHIDAIPNAGMYDGTVGVLAGLEAIRALQRAGFEALRSIELVLFTAEEPTRFGIGCMGSRLLAGVLDASVGARLLDTQGHSLDEVRGLAGFTSPLTSVALPAGYYDAFVELHIEQGPLLERQGIDLGIVTNIAAPASLNILIEGEGGHAGAVLMPDRHDAFCAASELALAVELAAKSTGAIDTVATIGICEVFPGAVNSIPSRVRLTLDVRDTDQARRDGVLASIQKSCEDISQRRGVRFQSDLLNSDAPATCDPKLVEALARACETQGRSYQRMVSRAYHDSLFMARIVPIAMLFIPCRGGVSHRPDEYSSPEAIANGALILAETLAELSAK